MLVLLREDTEVSDNDLGNNIRELSVPYFVFSPTPLQADKIAIKSNYQNSLDTSKQNLKPSLTGSFGAGYGDPTKFKAGVAFGGGLKWQCSMFNVVTAKAWEQVVEALTSNTQDRTDEVVLIFERPLDGVIPPELQ